MFVKRTAELKLLTEQYNSPRSNLVILYGRKGIGKTSLLKEFMEGKPSYYYVGVECEDRMQLSRMNRQWSATEVESEQNHLFDYTLLFSSLVRRQSEKSVIILDEFHFILKNGPDLLEAFRLFEDTQNPVMFVLCSSSIRFIENEMVSSLGRAATYITSYLKLKEFTFVDFVNRFPKSSVDTCIYINAVMSGVPDYLEEWQEDRSVRNNIIDTILNKNNRLFLETQHFLKQELREPAVYNTILSSLAEGNRKLNEMHWNTGYSRAKILVYLKHLIELDIVEKLVPLGDEGKENVKKGLYRITDNFLHFWYRFVFPNLSKLLLGEASEVYETQIEPYLMEYMEEYFADVCMEYLKLMNLHQRMPVKYLWWDRWYGKNGTIDIIAKNENDKTLVGKCIWEDRLVNTEDYDKLMVLSKEAGLNPDTYYLFSKIGFSEELRKQVKDVEAVQLVGLEDL